MLPATQLGVKNPRKTATLAHVHIRCNCRVSLTPANPGLRRFLPVSDKSQKVRFVR